MSTPIKVSKLYEDIRTEKAKLAALETSMQQITGDATTAWEDTVMSEVSVNVTLDTLYTKYKTVREALNITLDLLAELPDSAI